MSDETRCDLCAAYDRIAELTRERDYYRRQVVKWAERASRSELSYAERVQLSKLDEFEAEMSG